MSTERDDVEVVIVVVVEEAVLVISSDPGFRSPVNTDWEDDEDVDVVPPPAAPVCDSVT